MADQLWADPNQMWNAPESPSGQPGQVPPLRIPGMNVPQGAQDQVGNFLGGQPVPAMPKTGHLNSATGHALDPSGQVDDANIWNKVMPNRGRLANALGTGALLGGMIGQGSTIGENVSNVARAISNLPYAKLAQQYQMSEPEVARQQQLAGIQKTQAEAEEARLHGQYFGGANIARIEADRTRMLAEAQARMEGAKPTPKWGIATEDGQSPDGTPYKKGQHVWGYESNVPVIDPNKGFIGFTKKFEASSTRDEEMNARWGNMGLGHTDEGRFIQGFINDARSGTGAFKGKGPDQKSTDQELYRDALIEFIKQTKVIPAVAGAQGTSQIPARPPNPIAEQRAINDKSDAEAYAQMIYKNTNLKRSEARQLPFFNQQAQSGSDETARVNQILVAHNNRLADLKSQYDRMNDKDRAGRSFMRFAEDNNYDKDKKMFKDQMSGAGPKVGDLKTFPNGKVGKWDGTGYVPQP